MAPQIHPTAVVHSGAELGVDIEIGPYTVVGPKVRVGDRTRIGAQVVIDGVVKIGEDNIIVGQASLGGSPQDLSYRGEDTLLEIGDRNTIREFVTINRGTIKGGGVTRIDNDCLLMACCHVAHDCHIEDEVILGNNVLLAGHVFVRRRANVSGAAAAHHFVTIGANAYVGGLTRVIQDVPPFMILEGHPSRIRGVNKIGLGRSGYDEEQIAELSTAYRELFRSKEPRMQVLERFRETAPTEGLVAELVEALTRTGMGDKGRYRESLRDEFRAAGEKLILPAPRVDSAKQALPKTEGEKPNPTVTPRVQ
ncbi:MAG: UDP-N-acetylglucosamine acyltransferase [Planctomycetota bacterium]|jgi:UDP-N-acetylglucosamine acyltransferase